VATAVRAELAQRNKWVEVMRHVRRMEQRDLRAS
jgi:hypothetical protein